MCNYGDMGIRFFRGTTAVQRYAAVCGKCDWVGIPTTSGNASKMAKAHVKESRK